MKASTSLLLTALVALTNAQTSAQSTDFSPPFNPDPSFTSDIPISSDFTVTVPSVITEVDPATVTGSVTLTFFTESTSIPTELILTGTPDPRPSNFPGTGSVETTVTATTGVQTTLINGTQSITTSALVTSTRTTATSVRSTTSGASPSVTNQPAGAGGRIDGSMMAVLGGMAVGIFGVAVVL